MAPQPKQVKPADQVVIGKLPQADLDRVGKDTLPSGDEYIDNGADREPNAPNAIFTVTSAWPYACESEIG